LSSGNYENRGDNRFPFCSNESLKEISIQIHKKQILSSLPGTSVTATIDTTKKGDQSLIDLIGRYSTASTAATREEFAIQNLCSYLNPRLPHRVKPASSMVGLALEKILQK